jgi:hypothetical protein
MSGVHSFALDPRHDPCVVMIDGMTSLTGSASGGQLAGAAAWYLVVVSLSLSDCPDSHQVNELEKPDPEMVSGIGILALRLEMELSREIECVWRPGELQSFPCIQVSTAIHLWVNTKVSAYL